MVMSAKRQFQDHCCGRGLVFLCAAVVLLVICVTGRIFAAEQKAGVELARYRVFTLKNISREQAKKYLAEVNIGTVSQLPSTNTLLVTAPPGELIKAAAILNLVDCKEQFAIEKIAPILESKNLPANEQIEKEIGNISIGTFYSLPEETAVNRAIIDIHGDAVVAIASENQLERLISGIEKLQKAKTEKQAGEAVKKQPEISGELQKSKTGEANETDDELFNKLLRSLDDTEKTTVNSGAGKVGGTAEPNKPAAVKVADTNLPTTPSASSKQTEQPAPEAAEPGITPAAQETPATEKAETQNAIEKPGAETAAEETKTVPEPNKEKPKPQPDVKPAPIKAAAESQPPTRRGAPRPASKSQQYEPEAASRGEETLELDLPEKLEISDLLRLVGEYLHLDYMYDATKVKGDVTLKLRGPIKVKDLYPLLESVLKFKGFVMTRKGNLVTIVPAAEALDIDPSLSADTEGKIKTGDVVITRVFELKYQDAATAQNLLISMKLGTSITIIPETKTLIVTEFAYRMARIEELLELLDKPGEPKEFRFRQLKYTMANTFAPKIKSLVEQLGNISITVGKKETLQQPGMPPRQPQQPKPPAAGQPQTPSQEAKPTVYLDSDDRTNRILMIGIKSELDTIDELIDSLDVEQQDLRSMRVYEIQHVGAEEVREKLHELGIISGEQKTRTTQTQTPTAGRLSRPVQPPEGGAAAAAIPSASATGTTGEPLVEEPQVVIIESTNALLVNATAEQHTRIATIIGYVDTETRQAAINYKVYPLENQDPNNLAGVLLKFIQETITEKADEKDSKVVRTTTTTTKKTEDNISIIADGPTHSLIVYASKKNQQWISALIKELDEYRAQVLLDVTLVDVTKNDSFTFDMDVVSKMTGLASNVAGMGNFNIKGGIEPNVGFPSTGRVLGGTSFSGTGKGFYADQHIQALLTAMQKKGYGRVLARPKLLANDNQEGTIKTEDIYNIAQLTTTNTTSANGPVVSNQNVSFLATKSGIELKIKPHISKGNQLQLQINLVRTDYAIRDDTSITTGSPPAKNTYPTPPDTTTSTVTTVVTVPNDTTIILGGLEKLNQTKSGTKVPLLGDIPLIGGLFKSTNNTDTQNRLYVFVKAHILRPGKEGGENLDVKEVSHENRKAFEEYERQFQQLQDWPGIKPQPMDPNRVLKEE